MTAYFDCFSGIAGDMTVAALLDAGAPFEELERRLLSLGLPGYTLRVDAVTRSAIRGLHFLVVTDDPPAHSHGDDDSHGHHHGRHLSDIEAMIAGSDLSAPVKDNARAIFRRLGEAEAKVHGVPVESVHFHEVGAVDSIVDIVGACIALDLLGVTRIVASPLPVGHGMVRTAHGLMPIPAPATAALCAGIPTVPVDIEGELVTPTGAAILATLADAFGPPPPMTTTSVGYGAGTKDFPERPNLLRVVLGEERAAATGWRSEELLLLESNIDDMTPQLLGHFMELCLEHGALDATLAPVQMKKNRPGVTVSVLCDAAHREGLLRLFARETSTLGVRVLPAHRLSLPRAIEIVETPYGPVEVKVAALPDGGRKAHPEYDSARAAATRAGVPLAEVMRVASAAWHAGLSL
jgi:uncharacterized protein (TIGR00299 family) protein